MAATVVRAKNQLSSRDDPQPVPAATPAATPEPRATIAPAPSPGAYCPYCDDWEEADSLAWSIERRYGDDFSSWPARYQKSWLRATDDRA